MKKIFPTSVLLLFLCLSTISLRAQDTFGFLYSMNFATGNTNDFISKASFRGFSVDYRHHIRPELSVGLISGWYTFYEHKGSDTYSISDGRITLSGSQYRYLNSAPIMMTFNYHLKHDELISPFAGLGIGTTYNRVNVRMGLYDSETSTWHFTLAPEIGIKVGGGFGVWGFISGRYNHNFETSELDTQSYITINVGFVSDL